MNGEINIHAKFILKPSFIESKQNMDVPAIVLAFIFGLLIGSFLNVVIYRLPVRLDVVHGRCMPVHGVCGGDDVYRCRHSVAAR